MHLLNVHLADDARVKYLALLLNLLILRAVIPYLEYVFVLFAVLTIPMLYAERHNVIDELQRSKKVLKVFASFFAVTLLFTLAFILTDKKSYLIYRELAIAFFFIYYLFICVVILKSSSHLNLFIHSFKYQYIVIASIAAILGLIKFVFDIEGIELQFIKIHELYPVGTSLKIDHNFYSLGLIIGFVFILETYIHKNSIKWYNNLLLGLFALNIVLSSSRRGIVLFIFIHLIIVFLGLIKKWRFFELLNNLRFYLILVSVSIIILSLGFYYYGRHGSNFNFKVKTASIFNDYRSIIKKGSNLVESYHSLWSSDYITDLRNAQNMNSSGNVNNAINAGSTMNSGPVLNPHTGIIYRLESIPGWKRWMAMRTEMIQVDSFKILRIEGFHPDAYLYRFITIDTLVPNLFISMNLKIERSSKLQRVGIHWDDKNAVQFIPKQMKDGKWHHYKMSTPIDSAGSVQLALKFDGNSSNDYGGVLINGLTLSIDPISEEKVKGILSGLNMIRIPPRITLKETPAIVNIDTIPWNTSGNIIMDSISINSSLIISTFSDSTGGYVYKDIVIPDTQIWDYSAELSVYHAARNLRIETRNLTSDNYTNDVYYSLKSDPATGLDSWFKLNTYFYAEKGDTVRLALHLFQDTVPQLIFWRGISLSTYNNFPRQENISDSDFLKDTVVLFTLNQISRKKELKKEETDVFLLPRLKRWQFALELFNHYTVPEKIIGAGFDYIESFRKRFPSEYNDVEYPHNIILSVILYSGLFGLIVFLWLMVDTVRYYIINRLNVLFLAWLMIMSFVFFSSDTIFELPLLTGFTIIPLIYQMVKLKGS